MKKILFYILGLIVATPLLAGATQIFLPFQGGTGISTIPTYGQILVGNAGGTYTLTATSSLGIISGGASTDPFTHPTNFGVVTSATGTPLWAQAGIFASTTSYFANATTTLFTNSGSTWLTSLLSGALNVDANGLVYKAATTTFSAPLTYSPSTGAVTLAQATGAVNGYLGSTDWTTFNSKISSTSLSAAFPLSYNSTTGAFTFGGLSTSSTPTVGQLPFWTGVNTLGSVATGTITCTGTASCSTAGLSVIGGNLTIAGSGGSGTVTSISLGGGLDGASPITTTGTITAQVGTSSVPTIGNLAYWTGVGTPSTLGTVGTTSLSVTSAPFSFPSTLSVLGSGTGTYWGLSTTSNGVAGNIPYWTGTASLGTIATGTITCAGSDSCATTGLSVLGGNLTITGSGTYPFTPTSAWGSVTSATTSVMNFTNGMVASSTSHFTLLDMLNGLQQNGSLLAYASSTNGDTIFGLNAGGQNATTSPTGGYNSIFGSLSGNKLTTGLYNVAMGANAMKSLSTGNRNVMIGENSGINLDASTGNTLIGFNTDSTNSGNSDNTFVGSVAGANTLGGNSNIILGSGIYLPVRDNSNQMNIGDLLYSTTVYGNNASPTATPIANGVFGVSTSTPFAKLSVQGVFGDTLTNLFAVGSSSSVSATSTLFLINNIGNVGISTTSPTSALSVTGQGYFTSGIKFGDGTTQTTAPSALAFGFPWTPTTNFGINTNATSTALSLLGGVYASSTSILDTTYFTGGKVGVGTSTPAWLAELYGVRPSLAISDSSAGLNLKHWLVSSMGGNLYIGTSTDVYATSTPPVVALLNNGYAGFGTSTPTSMLSITAHGTGTGRTLNIADANNVEKVTVLDNGNVGLATSSPVARLTLDNNGTASSSILVYEYRPATTTTATLDCRSSNQIHWRLGTAATTLTLTGLYPGSTCRVIVENPGSAAGALTWAVASGYQLYWPSGTQPTQTTTAYKEDAWSFIATQSSSTISVFGNTSLNF